MKKILSVICIVIVLIALAGWFAYNKWKTSPSYSLMQTGIALQTKNTMMLEKYVDLDGVLDKAITATLTKAIKQETKNSDEGDFGDMFAMGLISAFKPQMVNMAKQAILTSMSEMNEAPAEGSAEADTNKTQNKAPVIESVKILNQEDGLASAEIILKTEEVKDPIRLVFGMRQHGDYWKIEEIQNTKELVEKAMAMASDGEGLGNMMGSNMLSSFGGLSMDNEPEKEIEIAPAKSAQENEILAEALVQMQAIADAQQRYQLQYGNYADSFEKLDTSVKNSDGSIATGRTANFGDYTLTLKKEMITLDRPLYSISKDYKGSMKMCQGKVNAPTGICSSLNY